MRGKIEKGVTFNALWRLSSVICVGCRAGFTSLTALPTPRPFLRCILGGTNARPDDGDAWGMRAGIARAWCALIAAGIVLGTGQGMRSGQPVSVTPRLRRGCVGRAEIEGGEGSGDRAARSCVRSSAAGAGRGSRRARRALGMSGTPVTAGPPAAFTAQQTFPTGTNARAVAVADSMVTARPISPSPTPTATLSACCSIRPLPMPAHPRSPRNRPSPPAPSPALWPWPISIAMASPTSPSPTTRALAVSACSSTRPRPTPVSLPLPRNRHSMRSAGLVTWRWRISTAMANPISSLPTRATTMSTCCSTRPPRTPARPPSPPSRPSPWAVLQSPSRWGTSTATASRTSPSRTPAAAA